jgi:GH24 family phage-related lysozyme (muramidase)
MDQTQVIARLERFEGRTNYMYRCTGGEVTIGIGHAILSVADAPQLSWQTGADQAQADWATIEGTPKGQLDSSYSHLTTCRMSDDAINQLAADDVQRFTGLLKTSLPNWDSYPAPAQEALFDMAYNLGVGGLLKFHNMLAAVNAGDWETAAQQCHRMGIDDERNQETATLFRQAAG